MRTSQTDPLRIDEVAVGRGRIGLTICPGKTGGSVFGPPWSRDLGVDLETIRRWGAGTVVSLVEETEMAALGVPGLGAGVAAAGMAWHHLPIRDLEAPDGKAMQQWADVSPALHRVP